MIQGAQAWAISRCVKAGTAAACESVNCHVSRGFQTRRSDVRAIIEPMPATTSVSDGPTKLEIRNCNTANVPPQTSTAGQTPARPRQPDMVHTIQAGMISEN